MAKSVVFAFLLLVLFSGCNTDGLIEAVTGSKVISFNNKEWKMKIVYLCEDKPSLEEVKIRAKKAHEFYIQKNASLVESMIDDMTADELFFVQLYNFNIGISDLAEMIDMKYQCQIINTIEY